MPGPFLPPPSLGPRARLRILYLLASGYGRGSFPTRSSLPAHGKGTGQGPYLSIDFCVLRRCAAAQAAQKHQQQRRQQSRPLRRLPAAKEAACPGRPPGRAPFAAHALGAQPGPESCTRGSPARRRRVPSLGSETCDAPWLPAGGRAADLPVPVPAGAA